MNAKLYEGNFLPFLQINFHLSASMGDISHIYRALIAYYIYHKNIRIYRLYIIYTYIL